MIRLVLFTFKIGEDSKKNLQTLEKLYHYIFNLKRIFAL